MSRWLLSTEDAHSVWLDVVGDETKDLTIAPGQLDAWRKNVALTNGMFGAVPLRHYDFLVAVTDQLPNDGGSEHQESSEIPLPAGYFLNSESTHRWRPR